MSLLASSRRTTAKFTLQFILKTPPLHSFFTKIIASQAIDFNNNYN